MKDLVSIITPCYNGETFIFRLFDSILRQTYQPIEFIFINDGSTDNTERLALSYQNQFKDKGIEFKYIYQNNAGQAEALNKGLKKCNGTYVTWPDSDDFYAEDKAIECLVNELSETDNTVGGIRCEANVIDEETLEVIGYYQAINKNNYKLFFNCLLEKDFWFVPGCYIFKVSILDKVIDNRIIFESRAGQNWQLYLPLFYGYKCLYSENKFFNYLVRKSSHSHGIEKTIHGMFKRFDDHREILIQTILNIKYSNENDMNKYLNIIDCKYINMKFRVAIQFRNKDMINKYYKELKLNHPNTVTTKDKILYYLSKSSLILRMADFLKRINLSFKD